MRAKPRQMSASKAGRCERTQNRESTEANTYAHSYRNVFVAAQELDHRVAALLDGYRPVLGELGAHCNRHKRESMRFSAGTQWGSTQRQQDDAERPSRSGVGKQHRRTEGVVERDEVGKRHLKPSQSQSGQKCGLNEGPNFAPSCRGRRATPRC